MKAIIIDDEPLMLRSFCRYLKHIPDQEIIGQFEDFCQRGRCGNGCIGRNFSEMDRIKKRQSIQLGQILLFKQSEQAPGYPGACV